jgi:L-aspartate oxidase
VLILGSGVAGLSAALEASRDPETAVLLIAKEDLGETATCYAQGGVAAVLDPEATGDSVAQHAKDTLEVAAGLANEEVARTTAEDGVERVNELIERGARFDRKPDGNLHFTLEGGHTFPRILHRGDTSGQEIGRVLLEAVLAQPNITVFRHTFAVDLLTRDGHTRGALLSRPDGELETAWARCTILATGGVGRLYRETTNPQVNTGDGIAMAFRAGVAVEDLEFIQFHPTALYLAGADRFLITEAVRGEGGVLRDGAGNRFMHRFHALAELAPRDVVSRGIINVMREQGDNKVLLDLSAIPPEKIRLRFPKILEILKGFGIDILREPIPVRPSAHYTIGGIPTDLQARTSLRGLFAAGEVASTGLHGANRLASNSLLEGLVFGHRAGKAARLEAKEDSTPEPFSVGSKSSSPSNYTALDLADLTQSLRSLLWKDVGLERDGAGLQAALGQIEAWIPYGLGSAFHDVPSWTVQNMLLTAYLLTLSALRREESRGVHFRVDFPERDDTRWQKHLSLTQADILRIS